MAKQNNPEAAAGHRAFSLLELAIVLVVLGLLVGGIIAGRALIRASELRSITAQMSKYQAATYAFRDKYFALPGDMTNATQFWGAAAGTGSDTTCWLKDSSTLADTKMTCNGNGDGNIDNPTGTLSVDYEFNERFRAWQQLANAGVVEGTYCGVHAGTVTWNRKAGTTSPATKLSSVVIDWQYVPAVTGSALFFDNARPMNMLEAVIETDATATPFTPEEAWNFDKKIDDGKPGIGHVLNIKSSYVTHPSCTTTDDATTAEYNIADTAKRCPVLLYSID